MMEQQPNPGPDGLIGETVGDHIARDKLGEAGKAAMHAAYAVRRAVTPGDP
jgi:hypothetical protein